MKIKKLFLFAFVVAAALLSACGDDEKPSLQFVFDGDKITLKGAKIYLTREGEYNGHTYRDYMISDGEYTNANGDDGWDLDDYDGATYYLAIELGVPVGEEFAKGEFNLHSNWSVIGEDENITYLYFESGEDDAYIEYYNDDSIEEDYHINASGGFDDGEKITLKFSGKIMVYRKDPNGENWIQEVVSGKFYFTGTVHDERDLGSGSPG